MPNGVICQMCGIEAPSKYVEFYYNIGALVIRWHKCAKGNLCKRCIHKTFWKFTAIDITAGWWGMISLFVTPIFLINNVARYLAAIPLPAPGPNAAPPQLTPEAIDGIQKYRAELIARLNNKEPLNVVAEAIARQAGATPGQVVLFVRALARASQPAPIQPPTPAFPVIPLQQQSPPLPAGSPAPPPLPATPATPAPANTDTTVDLIDDLGLR